MPAINGGMVRDGLGRDGADVAVPAPTQRERSELSTRRLLDATAALIAERGYERTTLAEIGRRAGYSHGLVNRRFGSKANLLAVLVERMSSRFGHERLPQLVGDRIGIEALQHVILEISRDARRSPEDLRTFYALIFEGLKPIPELQDTIRELGRRYHASLLRLVCEGLAAGRVRPGTDPVLLTDLVYDAIRGASYHWMLDPSRGLADRLEALAAHLGEVYTA
jgi:AcrR family transcriptional regulator